MQTVNQLIDKISLSGVESEKLKELMARLHDLKMISGGLTKVENTDQILKIIALEKAKNHKKLQNIENR